MKIRQNEVCLVASRKKVSVRGIMAGATAAIGGAVLAGQGIAQAALSFAGVTLNTADVESIMMLVIPALAALWGFRKIIKTMNRS